MRNLGARNGSITATASARRWGPANVTQPALAVTGACMYIKRAVSIVSGRSTRDTRWHTRTSIIACGPGSGFRVSTGPAPSSITLSPPPRGTAVRERERTSQRVFWRRWGEFFDARPVRNADGALQVIYVTEDTGVGGGHRDIFEHLNGLRERGHEAELWSLAGEPTGSPSRLRCARLRTTTNW